MALFLGIDVGTSGCRAVVIDEHGAQITAHHVAMAIPSQENAQRSQNGEVWWQAVCLLLKELASVAPINEVTAIAVDGTSSTLLITDKNGIPLRDGLMYNDARSHKEAEQIAAIAPAENGAHGASSALAKLLWFQKQGIPENTRHALHQADWIAGQLSGQFGVSDENNCLKLGYDVINRCWPEWFDQLEVDRSLLPEVTIPGTTIGTVQNEIANQLGLSPQTRIVSGTTDSIAAFLASGASEVGDAVTSLGSTLALKVLSDKPVFAPEFGVYSHRLGDRWLVGGASNCGGTTLLHFFNTEQMATMTPQLDPNKPTGLDYYPLPSIGERFPVNDPELTPRVVPRPADDHLYFQGLLEGIAAVEQQGYRLLAELGTPYPTKVLTMGGGAGNPAWHAIRQNKLGIPVEMSKKTETALGPAMLALNSEHS
ncbi:Carbohydrate kinase, FGGY family [hydrothermal vent metagenome]|uniref:Carbohydrate kinase, FGGY family n=1 Tax=hydrothermal vent metagenome TaxID=652676 RepID=A0A3B1A4P1_9ZZZZ